MQDQIFSGQPPQYSHTCLNYQFVFQIVWYIKNFRKVNGKWVIASISKTIYIINVD